MTKEERDRRAEESFFPFGLLLFYGTPMMLAKYDPPVWLICIVVYCWVWWIDLIVIQRLWDPYAPDLSREPEE